MLDSNQDGKITKEECHSLISLVPLRLNQTLSPSEQYNAQTQSEQLLQLLLETYFKKPRLPLSFEEFLHLNESFSADICLIFLRYFAQHFYLVESLQSYFRKYNPEIRKCQMLALVQRQHLKAKAKHPLIDSQLQPQIILKPSPVQQKGLLQIQKKGFLYRIMDKNTLKHYWYELRGQCLYMYRNQTDKVHKSFIYLGVDSYTRRIESEQQSEDGTYKVYGFELVTPNKLRKFFHIEKREFQAWYECVRAATTFKEKLQEKYELKDKLANGNGGSVWRAYRRADHYPVAIKIIDKQKLEKEQLITLSHEVEILKTCKHKHIADCLQVIEEVDYMNIVMEYIEGGTLKEYMMSRKKRISEPVIKNIAHQLLMALYYLKSLSIVHRDIKPDNIMLAYEVSNPNDVKTIPSIKLMDFGLSQFMGTNEFSTHPFGTLTYVAPQVISLIPYRFEVDMYSVGVILYQMSSGHVPFDSSDQEKLIDMIQFHTAEFSQKAGFASVSKEAISLISLMLEKEGNLRVTPKQALMSSWFTTLSQETVITRMKAGRDHFRVFTSSE